MTWTEEEKRGLAEEAERVKEKIKHEDEIKMRKVSEGIWISGKEDMYDLCVYCGHERFGHGNPMDLSHTEPKRCSAMMDYGDWCDGCSCPDFVEPKEIKKEVKNGK